MNQIKIQTTQNVLIGYEIGSIADRLIAALIDWLVILAYAFLVTLILMPLNIIPGSVLGWSITFLIFFYDITFELLLNGQSIGKRARNLKVAKLDGSQPSLGNYLLRWLFRPVDIGITAGAIAIVTILWNGKGQRSGDILAGTTVIKLSQRVSLADTIFTNINDDYQVIFPQANKLSTDDIVIIKEVLNTYEKLETPKLRRSLLRKTQEKIIGKMGIETTMAPADFLQTVLKDYNAITGQL